MQAGQREVKADTLQDGSQNVSAVVQKLTSKVETSDSVKQNSTQSESDNATQVKQNASANVAQNEKQNVVQNSLQNGMQNSVQIKIPNDKRVVKTSAIEDATQVDTKDVVQDTTQDAPRQVANNQTVTTTNLDLNFAKLASRENLLDSKIETSSSSNDLNTQTDPSKLNADDFAPNTKWTPAGWTRTNPQYTAKTSKLILTGFDKNNNCATNLAGGQANFNLDFTIDKNQLAKNRRFLVGSVQTTFNNRRQDLNQINFDGICLNPYIDDTILNFGGTNLTVDGKNLGYISTGVINHELDVYFT